MSFYQCLTDNPNKILYDVSFKSVTADVIIPSPTPIPDGLLISQSGTITNVTDGTIGQVLVTDGANNPTWQTVALPTQATVLSKGSSVYVSGSLNTNCFFGFGAKSLAGDNGLTPPAGQDAGSFIGANNIIAPVESLIVVPPNTTYSNCKILMTAILNDCTQDVGAFGHRCELHKIDSINSNVNQFLGLTTTLQPVSVTCVSAPQTFITEESTLFNITNSNSFYEYYAVLWDFFDNVGSTNAVMHVSYTLTYNN